MNSLGSLLSQGGSSGASSADVESGASTGSSLLAEWNKYATSTASTLGDMSVKLQANTSNVFNVAGTTTSGMGESLSSGLTSFGGSLTNLSSAGLESFRGANSSMSAALSTVQSGVEGISSSVKTGANRLNSEMLQAANLANAEMQRGVNATASGLHKAGSMTVTGVTKAGSLTVTGMTKAGSMTVSGVKGVGDSIGSGVQGLQSFSTTRLLYFFALISMGTFLMGMALVIGLPVIVLAPAKFAFCFTIGSLCNMGAVAALRGPAQQMQQMMQPDRLPFSASYLCSMLGTLWAALIYHSYVLTVAFSIWQIMALLYYVATHFPMGVGGMKIIAQIGYTMMKPFLLAFSKCCSVTMGAVLPI
mmetsp:Transcript_1371/g.1948  ORF Transcript_1371/g.1948 Transcript_1371/m.1948 type:complete len:361 (+) Transcript_1371:258-1340(+)|eukprot:CAMPEP_0196571742 /NCGR_PEP_ID=MMETSP1081-20130531/1872_1 /TAXON_ID=36882 /ORGANISM="Pyramimonas amylifera, Strain CCMP720" /LENGTH=360 /DNA_ID=CAMNT_0041888797 /DNA_START=258 /DNA_END=1340 /DNA_ORIENTATION=+